MAVGRPIIFSRRVLQRALLVIGTTFVAALIIKTWEELQYLLKNADLSLFLASIFLAFFGNFLSAMLLRTLLRKYGINIGVRKACLLFFWSQITKYIPGKIWVIVYQVTAIKGGARTGAVLFSNIEMMAAAVITTAAISIALLLGSIDGFYPVLAMIIGLIAVVFICGTNWWALLMRISRSLPLLHRVNHPAYSGRVAILQVFAYYIGFAFSYAAAGMLMLSAMFGLSGREAMHFVAYQGFSWITGVLAFIVPAGVGVREAAFIWLGAEFSETVSTESLAAMAIVFRVWYLLQEIVGATVIGSWNLIAPADKKT